MHNTYLSAADSSCSFTDNQLDRTFQNWFDIATYGNGTLDSDWPACVGCAFIHKSLQRVNMALPDICSRCFERFCYSGAIAATPANPTYDPSLLLGELGLVHCALMRSLTWRTQADLTSRPGIARSIMLRLPDRYAVFTVVHRQ